MKTVIIANPAAAAGRVGRILDSFHKSIEDAFGPGVLDTTSLTRKASALVTEAVDHNAERIVVVGGDGTLGEAINGLRLESTDPSRPSTPELIYLPVGTGSDFARSVGLNKLSVDNIAASAETRTIDVGVVRTSGGSGDVKTRYFINEMSIGASARIVQKVNQSTKKLGGPFSFMAGTIRGLMGWRGRTVQLHIDNEPPVSVDITVLAIANGRYFGGGMRVAPNANLHDGKLDLVIIKDAGVGTFLRHGAKLYAGKHVDLPFVRTRQVRKIKIEPADARPDPIFIETDGEIAGAIPATIEVIQNAVRLVAPWARAERVRDTSDREV